VQREEKEAQLAKMSNPERKRSARTAHEVEKARRQEQQGPAPKPETSTKPAVTPARKRPDPIGLMDIPDISFVVKGH
jgi:hypothetical protein